MSFIASSDTTSLDDTHPSVVFQISCTNGYPVASTNLGYSLLNGAIGTYSGSRVTWYTVTSWQPSLGNQLGDNGSYAYYGTKRLVENPDTRPPAPHCDGAARTWGQGLVPQAG